MQGNARRLPGHSCRRRVQLGALVPPMIELFALSLHHDQDVVTARQRAAQIAGHLGFDASEQTRVATAVSEIVRNAFRYTGGGRVLLGLDLESRPQRLVASVQDRGRGIPHLDDVLAGRYTSTTGMGIGILGARRLMDRILVFADQF